MTLVPGQHVPDAICAAVERVVEDDAGVARHPEHDVDTSLDQALGQNIRAASLKLPHLC
jgi:hypothetical protein